VLPLLWAAELAAHRITVMAVTPGILRSESMLQHFGVTEENWQEAGKKDSNFLQSESPLFVGRAIAALAADPKVQAHRMLFGSWELGRDYGLADYEGRRPDWAVTRSTSPLSRLLGSICSARAGVCCTGAAGRVGRSNDRPETGIRGRRGRR
jgi:hypothetical protein